MSKEFKTKRATQARLRRQKQKSGLKLLEQQANAEGATAEVKAELFAALQKRKSVLDFDKERIAKRRKEFKIDLAKKVPTALEKAKKTKKARGLLYSKYKSQDIVRLRKSKYRSRKRFELIRTKVDTERKGIDSRCMDFQGAKITPLGAAVRYCDLDAVRYVIEKKASLTRRSISTLICTPLYDATWMGKTKIAQLLLEKSALPDGGESGGALHGAIHNKMFKTIKIMLDRGCQVNEYHREQTPLGAALTCGKLKSGDVRLVNTLLAAKADPMKKTKMCYSHSCQGIMVDHIDLARKYSNQHCLSSLINQNKQTISST